MTTLFISDLHLEPRRPEVALAFANYLQTRAMKADALYILGDLFEAWIGDDFENEFTQQVKQAIKAVSDSGVPTCFMHGNRDFLIGELFCAQTGCQLLDDPTLIELGGRKALLMHGDTLCTRDVEYQKLRQMVRDPAWQAAALSKPIPERLAMAQSLRDVSRQETGDKAEDIMDVTPAEVVRVMAEHNVDLLIHGHTHRPAVHRLEVAGNAATRIVLGDWYQKGWQLAFEDDGSYQLTDFDLA